MPWKGTCVARASLSTDAVVDIALRILDEEGVPALTLSAVAGRAGVATPSLYKHVRNLADLRELVSIRILNELADRGTTAVLGRSGDEALREFMLAWRDYVIRHPGRYAFLIQTPEPALDDAADRLLGILFAVLRSYGLRDSEAIHAARALRSAVHGFTSLEAAGGFGLPEKLDDSYEFLIRMVIAGLRAPR
jgi:AcrR family transcriptional regulator